MTFIAFKQITYWSVTHEHWNWQAPRQSCWEWDHDAVGVQHSLFSLFTISVLQ